MTPPGAAQFLLLSLQHGPEGTNTSTEVKHRPQHISCTHTDKQQLYPTATAVSAAKMNGLHQL